MQTGSILHIVTSSHCDIVCAHCMCAGSRIKRISDGDVKRIVTICKTLQPMKLQLTGGEPTLHLDMIAALLDTVVPGHPNIQIELLTNAAFARSEAECQLTLSQIRNLSSIVLSYDKFHAAFVPDRSLQYVIAYARKNSISVSGIASTSSPDDLCHIVKYEEHFRIPFCFQIVLPTGRAIVNRVSYQYTHFEPDVLSLKCPNSGVFVYIPTYGLTHCCSTLFLKGNKLIRQKMTFPTVQGLVKSWFHSLMSKYSFAQLCGLTNRRFGLKPRHTMVCELCHAIMPSLLLGVQDEILHYNRS